MPKFIFILVALLSISACSNLNNPDTATNITPNNQIKTNKPAYIINVPTVIKNPELAQFFAQWQGTKYRLGGTSQKGIDCSAFMQQVFSQIYNINLPRSTSQQRHLGKSIKKQQLQLGDLVFFRKNRHVGIYLGNGKFMHASTSQGVTISSLDENYWRKNYTQSRRIL